MVPDAAALKVSPDALGESVGEVGMRLRQAERRRRVRSVISGGW
jgi:hypothetical protein